MSTCKIFTIFMVVILTQTAFSRSVDDDSDIFDSSEEEMRKNPTPIQKLCLFTFDNFLSLAKHYSAGAAKVSRYILKDESVVANNKPEVMELKKNLTLFVEKYESNKKPQLLWDIMDIYSDTTDHYFETPEEKITPESTFIVETLNKYNARHVAEEFGKEFVLFMENFSKMFEENKTHLDKPMLDWYKKYERLTDLEEKIDAFSGFIDMA